MKTATPNFKTRPYAHALVGLLCGIASALLPTTARAESPPVVDDQTRSAARALTEQGLKLYDAKNYAAAVDKLARADALVRLPTTGLNLARAYVKLGKLVEASEKYLVVTMTTLDSTAAPAQKRAQEVAATERVEVQRRIGSLDISLDPAAPDAVVTLDGIIVPSALVGVPRPVNPGSHQVEARLKDARAAKEVVVGEGGAARVVLTLAAASVATSQVAAPTPAAVQTAPQAAPPSTDPPAATAPAPSMIAQPQASQPASPDHATGTSGLTIGGAILTGLGGAGLAAGGVLALVTQSTVNDLVACSDDPACTRADQIALHDRALRQQQGSLIALGVGAAVATGGVVLLVMGRKPKEPSRTEAALLASPGGAALRIRW